MAAFDFHRRRFVNGGVEVHKGNRTGTGAVSDASGVDDDRCFVSCEAFAYARRANA